MNEHTPTNGNTVNRVEVFAAMLALDVSLYFMLHQADSLSGSHQPISRRGLASARSSSMFLSTSSRMTAETLVTPP